MSQKGIGLVNKIAKKNIQDTIILGLVTILIVAFMLFIDNKVIVISSVITILLFYFLECQISKNELLKSVDKLVDNELNEFQKVSAKILQLSEKQHQLSNKHNDMLNNLMQMTKIYKNNSIRNKEKTQTLSAKMEESVVLSEKETKSLNNNINSMQILKSKVQLIAELIIELTDYIKQIGTTVGVVENISEQTNMLALNAAVEAARAGEYGKGFAVVAGEIRKLADESKQATNKITALVVEIEQTTSSTIMATEDGAREIEAGVKYANEISFNINNIVNGIKEINQEIDNILVAYGEQNNISGDIYDITETMQKNTAEYINMTEECMENIKAFSDISVNIKNNIGN